MLNLLRYRIVPWKLELKYYFLCDSAHLSPFQNVHKCFWKILFRDSLRFATWKNACGLVLSVELNMCQLLETRTNTEISGLWTYRCFHGMLDWRAVVTHMLHSVAECLFPLTDFMKFAVSCETHLLTVEFSTEFLGIQSVIFVGLSERHE